MARQTTGASTAPKKSASITTEIVLGAAAKSLSKVVGELEVVVSSVKSLESKGEELTLLVVNKENEISELDVVFTEKERQLTLDLELKMKGNAEKVVTEFLYAQGKIAVAQTDFNALKKELETTKSNYLKDLEAEIGKAKGIAKSHYESEAKLLQSEHKTEQATNTSKIVALEEKVKWLEIQSSKWELALAEERKAGVQRAQASAIGTISLGNDGASKR